MPPTTDVCPSSTSTVVMARCVLFNVDTFGVDNSRPLPELSSAESATSRLNAPLTEPRVNPTALVAPPAAGRFTAVPPTPAPGARPAIVPLLGNAREVVLPRAGETAPVKPH